MQKDELKSCSYRVLVDFEYLFWFMDNTKLGLRRGGL